MTILERTMSIIAKEKIQMILHFLANESASDMYSGAISLLSKLENKAKIESDFADKFYPLFEAGADFTLPLRDVCECVGVVWLKDSVSNDAINFLGMGIMNTSTYCRTFT
jgi:hypothetical protein